MQMNFYHNLKQNACIGLNSFETIGAHSADMKYLP